MILLPVSYFPPIEYFQLITKDKNVVLELFENYPKQTLRNRCYLYSSNGKIYLSVPVQRKINNFALTKDIKISYNEPWQKIHLKSIESAYNHSPYYEYYNDYFVCFFERKFIFLLDLNIEILNKLLKICKIQSKIAFTENFIQGTLGNSDFRNFFNNLSVNHKVTNFKNKEYSQVFDSKHGFIPNLSILDLLFNVGPEISNFLYENTV